MKSRACEESQALFLCRYEKKYENPRVSTGVPARLGQPAGGCVRAATSRYDPVACKGTISPDVVRAAIGLRRSHPQAPALGVLDACFMQRTGSLADLGPDALDPCGEFGQLLAAAFDRGMEPGQWRMLEQPQTVPAVRDALLQAWRECVVGPFCARYGVAWLKALTLETENFR